MTDKEIEGVSPEEWAKALEGARNTLELRDAGIIIESDYLCARALLAAQAEIERLTNEMLSYRDLADEQSGKVHDIRTLAEGMAGALRKIADPLCLPTGNAVGIAKLLRVIVAQRDIATAALAAYRKQDDETEGK